MGFAVSAMPVSDFDNAKSASRFSLSHFAFTQPSLLVNSASDLPRRIDVVVLAILVNDNVVASLLVNKLHPLHLIE